MNQKELGELRRRFQPDRSAVSRIYGCYVNTQREVISYLDESLGRMPLEESEKYLGLLKKSLSGALGKNLIDVVFTTEQVMDSDEYRLLSALRESELKNGEIRQEFYQRVIESLDMGESNYLILMAYDAYDVPRRGGDGQPGDSENVFRYILCCVCPVKDGKPELGYFPGENEFHNCVAGQIVSAPELGFLYPAFDNRAANLYNAAGAAGGAQGQQGPGAPLPHRRRGGGHSAPVRRGGGACGGLPVPVRPAVRGERGPEPGQPH